MTCLGVTTIAGGNKTGYEDGPAQDASFSTNFEIIFVPEKCALLISDHGNQLIRQISLKAEDCARGSEFGELLKIIRCMCCYICMRYIFYIYDFPLFEGGKGGFVRRGS